MTVFVVHGVNYQLSRLCDSFVRLFKSRKSAEKYMKECIKPFEGAKDIKIEETPFDGSIYVDRRLDKRNDELSYVFEEDDNYKTLWKLYITEETVFR